MLGPRSVRSTLAARSSLPCLQTFDILGENKLSLMFSGRWEPLRDAAGNIFVDYSSDVFMPLVEWLRDIRDAEPNEALEVNVKPEGRYSWIRMMKALAVDVKHLVRAGVVLSELLDVGYTFAQLEEVFPLSDFRSDALRI